MGIDIQRKREEFRARQEAVLKIMDLLEIPCNAGDTWTREPPTVSAFELYDILMDPEKLQVLVSKLRNKAFW